MPLLADSKFEREALVSHAKFTPVAASVNLPREKLSSLQFDGAQIPGRQTPSLQIPWAAIGAVFAVADAGASILASLVGAEGYRVTAACVATCGLGNSPCLRIGKRRAG
jgi:hypothetical protein